MNNFIIVNADTDSISFARPDGSTITEEEQIELLISLNSLFPEKIKWEHDGLFEVVVVVKAKNYILLEQGSTKYKTKGSALKASMKEAALREFIDRIIKTLVYDKKDTVVEIYNEYIREIHNLTDISRWCSKKTITESVLNPKRLNEQKVLDALHGKHVQMGDKVFMYFTQDSSLSLQEDWDVNNPNHDTNALCEKLYKTVQVFKNVLDMDQFPNCSLKNNERTVLQDILGRPHLEKPKRPKKTA